MSIDAVSEAALSSSFVVLMQLQKASVLNVASISCVIHIKGRKSSSSASRTALISSQAASTTVRTERHFYTSVLTNVRPVWNAVCAAVLISQQHVRNYPDETTFFFFFFILLIFSLFWEISA